jgi:adducin
MIAVRIGTEEIQYLVAPTSVPFSDITASSLVKVDESGSLVSGGPELGPNRATFALVNMMAAARPDFKAVVFINSPAVVNVSTMTCGLLPLCIGAMALGHVPFCEAEVQPAELRSAVGSNSKAAFIRGKGVLIGAESVEEVFHIARWLMSAVDIQVRSVPLGVENLILPSAESCRKAYELANQIQETPSGGGDMGTRKWHRGELEYEALMRRLENAGYRTGYPFHDSLIRKMERLDRVNSDVEVPPTLTSVAMPGDDGSAEKVTRSPSKVDWVNASNAYKKQEIDVPGAPKVKKLTKWVPDKAPGEVIKIDSPNHFVPVGADPKELKTKFHQIRRDYYDDNITCGPQSRILEGVTWEEAQKMKEGNIKSDTIIVVGAASQAIIQRGHESEGAVFKTYYAPNPFDSVTEEDVEQYRAEIEHRNKGESTTTDEEALSPGPEGQLISTEERMQHVRELQTSPEPESVDVPVAKVSRAPLLHVDVDAKPAEPQQQPLFSPPVMQTTEKSPTRNQTTDADVGSPAKSTGGGGSSTAASPAPAGESPDKKKKEKKKRGFRMPSFSSKKKDK